MTTPTSLNVSRRQPQPYRYGGNALLALTAIYALSFWFYAAGSVGNAAIFYLGGTVVVFGSYAMFLFDWHGLTSLNGRIIWGRLSGHKKFWWAAALIFFVEFVLAVYLFLAMKDHLAATQQMPWQALRALWQRYLATYRNARFPVAAATALVLIAFVVASGLALAGGNPPNLSSNSDSGPARTTTTSLQQQAQAPTSTATQTVTRPPAATPTAAPTATTPPAPGPTPTTTPQPAPTTPPAPSPTPTSPPPPPPSPTPCPGVNCNPWGYNFTPGNYIYNPPVDFCSYFNCIPSFWDHTNGYVMECQDGTYSHSGGRRGSCSSHGGDLQPLYSH